MDQQNQTTNPNSQFLNKKERYFLRRQQKETELRRQLRNKKIKKILLFLLPTLLIVGGLTFIVLKLSSNSKSESQTSQTGAPKMEINLKEYDLGNVSMAAGVVKKTFEIKNNGSGDLKIEGIRTSCHCTTAVLKIGEKKSPEFGLDGSGFWSQNISPSQMAYLEIIFDPAYHGPQGVGQAVRAIYLSTNDPQNRTAEVRLIANVTP